MVWYYENMRLMILGVDILFFTVRRKKRVFGGLEIADWAIECLLAESD